MNLILIAEQVSNYNKEKGIESSLTDTLRGLEYLIYYGYLEKKDDISLSDVVLESPIELLPIQQGNTFPVGSIDK